MSESNQLAAQILASGVKTLATEAQALTDLRQRLDVEFVRAVQLLLACRGRAIVCGLGKTGHIARKVAATLASTGTPAMFMHAAEALHGDLGMLTGQDMLLALSHSGSGQELLTVVAAAHRLNVPVIALTGNAASELAQLASVHLDVSVASEACPMNLAPTASTTAALAMGDALAVACLTARGFTPEDFARSHPGGALGRRLLTRVCDVMRQGQAIPKVTASASMTMCSALESAISNLHAEPTAGSVASPKSSNAPLSDKSSTCTVCTASALISWAGASKWTRTKWRRSWGMGRSWSADNEESAILALGLSGASPGACGMGARGMDFARRLPCGEGETR